MREFVFRVKLDGVAVGNVTVNVVCKDYLMAVKKLQSIVFCDEYELVSQKKVDVKSSPYEAQRYKKVYSPSGS